MSKKSVLLCALFLVVNIICVYPETYIKIDMKKERLSSWMGIDFMKQLSALIDTSKINEALNNSVESRLYTDKSPTKNDSQMLDRMVGFSIDRKYILNEDIAALADAAGSGRIGFRFLQDHGAKLDKTKLRETVYLLVDIPFEQFVEALKQKGKDSLLGGADVVIKEYAKDKKKLKGKIFYFGLEEKDNKYAVASLIKVE